MFWPVMLEDLSGVVFCKRSRSQSGTAKLVEPGFERERAYAAIVQYNYISSLSHYVHLAKATNADQTSSAKTFL